MKVTYELEEGDYGYIHDVCLEAAEKSFSDSDIKDLFNKLVKEKNPILGQAVSWGWSDTCVRDELYEYVESIKLKEK